jgi:hypothetical protein
LNGQTDGTALPEGTIYSNIEGGGGGGGGNISRVLKPAVRHHDLLTHAYGGLVGR